MGILRRASSRDSRPPPPLASIGLTTSRTPAGREMAVAICPARTLPSCPMPVRYAARMLSLPVKSRCPWRPSPNVIETLSSSPVLVTKTWSAGPASASESVSCHRTSSTRTASVERTPSTVGAETNVSGAWRRVKVCIAFEASPPPRMSNWLSPCVAGAMLPRMATLLRSYSKARPFGASTSTLCAVPPGPASVCCSTLSIMASSAATTPCVPPMSTRLPRTMTRWPAVSPSTTASSSMRISDSPRGSSAGMPTGRVTGRCASVSGSLSTSTEVVRMSFRLLVRFVSASL